MKEIKQQNIVNFVDSYLVGETDLWVRRERERERESCSSDCLKVPPSSSPGGDGVSSWRIVNGRGDRNVHE